MRTPLDRARHKAYWRLLPLLFIGYAIAYVDRTNVGIAKLTMVKELPGFNDAVIGLGAGVFFLGYFLLAIPSTLLVERWSARKWISLFFIVWGIFAALMAVVKTPGQFYFVRFMLGVAEAGFFPGVIVYLTHWFPGRDRSRALAYFFVATPVAQIGSPKISNALLKFSTNETVNGVTVHHPSLAGLHGWQCVYIFWGLPAIILGVTVLFWLKNRPADAPWLEPEERTALEQQLALEKDKRAAGHRMTVLEAFQHPKVLLLALTYFCCVAGNYSIEFFLPSILQSWYALSTDTITWLVLLPPLVALPGQLLVGWSSDRQKERRFHTFIPIVIGASALVLAPVTRGHLPLTVACFMVGFAGIKSYQPAFWSLPSLFLTGTAAAGSIGLINSVGNLGGFLGPTVLGRIKTETGSFDDGVYFLSALMMVSAIIILRLGLGKKETDS
ncbi:MAG TPA: MFS transporter [Opitutaceae bacterium]|nr:MFS transporter [Opitutaceae bacterium]